MSALPLPSSLPGPTPGNVLTNTARTNEVAFGDGYGQYTGDGLNAVVGKLPVSWAYLTASERATLDEFLRERAGWQFILYTVPGESEPRTWRCKTWNITLQPGYAPVSLTLEEVFDL